MWDSGRMSAQAPHPAPAPGCAPSGVATPASSSTAARVDNAAPYPGAGTGFPYASGGIDERYGYAPAGPAVRGLAAPPFPGTEYVNMHEVFADGGYTSPKPITNPLAKTALWVSVFAIFGLPLIVGAVLAVIALVEAQKLPDRIGAHEAVAALIYDGIMAFVFVTFYTM